MYKRPHRATEGVLPGCGHDTLCRGVSVKQVCCGFWFLFLFLVKKKRGQERARKDQMETSFIFQGLLQELARKGEICQSLPSFRKRATVFLFLTYQGSDLWFSMDKRFLRLSEFNTSA